MPLRKKIIYLDQNFFSHACSGNQIDFLNRATRLKELVKKQLIICPYSDVHDKETHLSHKKKEQLWAFIKSTSQGKHFYWQDKIKEQQIINAYASFMRNGPEKFPLHLYDAIESDVHDWSNSLRVEIDWSVTNIITPDSIRKSKETIKDAIIAVLPNWQNSKTSLEDDYKLEIYEHGRILYDTFVNLEVNGTFQQKAESVKHRIIYTLMALPLSGYELEEKVKNVTSFLKSEYFSNIPHVNVSAGIWALIKQEIKENRFPQKEEEIRKAVAGLHLDIEHLSIFAPYCDAIFTENRMAKYLHTWSQHPLGGCSFKVFSVNNWLDFDAYLDGIENSISTDMLNELEIVYGG